MKIESQISQESVKYVYSAIMTGEETHPGLFAVALAVALVALLVVAACWCLWHYRSELKKINTPE